MNWIKGKFFILLLALFTFLGIAPFLGAYPIGRVLLEISLSIVLLSSLYAASLTRRTFNIALVLLIPALLISWLHYLNISSQLFVLAHIFMLFFLLYTTGVVLADVLREGEVTVDKIFGAVSGYLLIGLTWAFVFILLEWFMPGSIRTMEAFKGLFTDDMVQRSDIGKFIYFSFVSMTTLGYGDVVPANPPARAFAFLEATMGQMYLAVLVARLVGLHIASTSSKERE